MKTSSVLIVGCGDVGIRTGLLLNAQGWRVTGVRRNTTKLPAEFAGQAANYTQPGSLDFMAQLRPDFVLATFNPADRSIAGYKAGFRTAMGNLLAGLGPHRPRHILMASSTRVFAESNGGWVDEGSALTADDPWAAGDHCRRAATAGLGTQCLRGAFRRYLRCSGRPLVIAHPPGRAVSAGRR